ncbi:MAG: DUF2235 domain-containing protein [Rhodospirillales bacterium]|nr:DUF2235 domain-containing protein [Rhodospirillales bacterium]
MAKGGAHEPAVVPGERGRRVIAIFSDGTGNSSGKLFKTNVWRLYKALDTDPVTADQAAAGEAEQIAHYDNGVGTSTFRPLMLLGGVFGVGLKRNVLDLYTFLCRNYREGDDIYAFGFSRGAFTIRLVIGIVVQQGLVPYSGEAQLQRDARDAYRAYRKRFNPPGSQFLRLLFLRSLRWLRDAILRLWRNLTGKPLYSRENNIPIGKIAFVGLWDTVAAYGLPITEMSRGIDRWVWPLSMPNYKLSPKVQKARHALALDDERDTFHPLLWDEEEEERLEDAGEIQPGRMRQVWFAGMHSNVGGGYPDDALAFVSLNWMMKEAGAGLRLRPEAVMEVQGALNEFGPLHDSRRGLASYYRYQPRKIRARKDLPDPTSLIMVDPVRDQRAQLKSVVVHESVVNRIRSGTDAYAPIVLPEAYSVALADGGIVPAPETDAGERARQQEWVWNVVWRRRISYFTTVSMSLLLALMPVINAVLPPSACAGPQCLLVPVISAAGTILPGFVQIWIEAFTARPGLFAVLVIAILLLLSTSTRLQTRIHDRMRALWAKSLGRPGMPPAPRGDPCRSAAYRVRANPVYQRFFRYLKWRLVPFLFGLLVLGMGVVLLLAVPFTVTHRVSIAVGERSELFCTLGPAEPVAAPVTVPELFTISDRCWSTGLAVTEGLRYRVTLTVRDAWRDEGIAADPVGFESEKLPWYLRPAAFLRRSPAHRWLQPIVKVVPDWTLFSHSQALEVERVDPHDLVYVAEFEAARSGAVFLYVNDAINPWSSRDRFYANNVGSTEIRLELVQ